MQTIVAGRWNKHSSLFEETKTLRKIANLFELKKSKAAELKTAQDEATKLILRTLGKTGIDIITDGGIRWDSIFDITRDIGGCSNFSQLTRIPETNHFHRQPIVKLPLTLKSPILVKDLLFAKKHTNKPIVVSLPGPYSLTHQTENYKDLGFQEIAKEYAKVLNREIAYLLKNGAYLVRIEEPQIITNPEDFSMFKMLTAELAKDIDMSKLILATWYGDIKNLKEYFNLPFGIFWLDFVEGERNFEMLKNFPKNKSLVAGVFDGRESYLEDEEQLKNKLREILRFVSQERIFLSTNTDLDFLPFDIALEKVKRIVWFSNKCSSAGYMKNSRGAIKKITYIPGKKPKITGVKLTKLGFDFLPKHSFLTSAVGSYPQTPELREKRLKFKQGKINKNEYRKFIENHTRNWINFQDEIGMDVPVGGEFLREDMAVYFSTKLGGRLVDFVPSYENRRYRPVEYYEKVSYKESVTVNDFLFLQSLTERRVKETITGPATLADWALLKYRFYYYNRHAFKLDIARKLREEVKSLVKSGVKILQVDEPALTTKMGSFLSDIESIYEVIKGFENKIYLILHICYSDIEALDKAFPEILKLPFHQIHMEMANRNYSLLRIIKKHGFAGKDIGLGVIDVHTNKVETEKEIIDGVKKVLPYFKPEQIWITPDCGLKERTDEITKEKLKVMIKAAKKCRELYS